MWPSPATRWPTSSPTTLAPTSAMSPMNSCPTTIGTGMVACAHASQRWMWRSVPQIEVLRTRISTSSSPGLGASTSSSHNPGAGRALTNALMTRPSRDDAHVATDTGEGVDGHRDVVVGMGGGHLRADAGPVRRHDREREGDHEDPLGEQPI